MLSCNHLLLAIEDSEGSEANEGTDEARADTDGGGVVSASRLDLRGEHGLIDLDLFSECALDEASGCVYELVHRVL